MKDFYDVEILISTHGQKIERATLVAAIANISKQRGVELPLSMVAFPIE
jgi:hypothetical protein